jgi:hypothetical protein
MQQVSRAKVVEPGSSGIRLQTILMNRLPAYTTSGGDVAFNTTAHKLAYRHIFQVLRRRKNHADGPARWRRPTLLEGRNTQRHQNCKFHDDAQLIEFVKLYVQVNRQRPSSDPSPDIWNTMPPAIIGIATACPGFLVPNRLKRAASNH